ncbi:pyridoxal phosphate-dependent aminotransferase [Murimonas intestini]|mgnify:CR=1 FL=1|uniref:pyridoxal phosphate-dependent aminotransferase n=1 Tax=Murimonas intestini TaxID=1337051 RepID=UPI0011DCCDC5|nr:threonine-phosphate decarboxylase [Murimonas intestini]
METHIHGGDIYSRSFELDYSVNINPLGIPRAVKEAAEKGVALSEHYPDVQCRTLKRAIERKEGVSREAVICGNGAAELIFAIALGIRPGKALLAAPGFAEYEQALRAAGCSISYYTLKEENGFEAGRDFVDMVTEDLDIVFLCNPNNPTGIAYSRDFLRDVLVKCRECKVVLVVDECFIEFMDSPMEYTMRPFLEEYDNLFLLKAFTKTYAMAGLRLGYGLSSSRALLEAMAAVMQPWNVSIPAQMAGTAALAETGYVESARNLIRSERKYLTDNLRQLGLTVYDGAANFIFFKGPVNLGEACKDAGILLRDCSNYHSLGAGYFRIAVRTRKENELLVKTMQRIMGVS